MKTRILFIALVFAVIGCSDSNNQQKDLEKINELETKIYSENQMDVDMQIANQAIQAYLEFSEKYQEDSLAPIYLFKAGEISRNINKANQAIIYFQQVYDKYPDYEKAPFCLFLQAIIYEDQLGNLDKAKENYTLFVSKYPDHDFADDAKILLNNLGKTPEEIIQSFEAQQEQVTDSI